jgi:hypothetical protein
MSSTTLCAKTYGFFIYRSQPYTTQMGLMCHSKLFLGLWSFSSQFYFRDYKYGVRDAEPRNLVFDCEVTWLTFDALL